MKFTKEQQEYILNNYKTMSYSSIAEVIGGGATRINIGTWLTYRGLGKDKERGIKRNIFSDSDIDYIKTHCMDMTYGEIASHLGFTEKQIRSKAESVGIIKTRKFNSDYFHNIDTPLKAYFLGFIYADGWIVDNPGTRNYEFGMQLQSQDKYVLDKINDELGGIHLITHHTPEIKIINGVVACGGDSDTLRVFSKEIVRDLELNGIATNKTLKDGVPIVDYSLFYDFLRGYIDGDGCFYFDCKSHSVHMNITCAMRCNLEKIRTILVNDGIKCSIYKEKDRKYRLCCFDNNSMKLLVHRLYSDAECFCLKRKYEKIFHILNGSVA